MPPTARFGRTANLALGAALSAAQRDRDRQIGTDHLLIGLAAPIGSDSARALDLLGISEADVHGRFGREHRRGAGSRRPADYSNLANLVVSGALTAADHRGDAEAGSGDLLLSLARHRHTPGGRFLARLGVTPLAVAGALAQISGPLDMAADSHSSVASAAASAESDQDSATADVSVQCSHTVNAPAELAWELVSSPQAWSLNACGAVMFDVPDADGLRFYVGPIPGWSRARRCVVFEPVTEPLSHQITLSARSGPAGLCFTASVHAGLAPDWAEIRVTGSGRVPVGYQRAVTDALRTDLDGWLAAIDLALADGVPLQSAAASQHLVSEWAAEPAMEQPRRAAAIVHIDAQPEVVWNLVRRPWAAAVVPGPPIVFSGQIPGTPAGEPGEAWYGVHQHDDGSLGAVVLAVTQYAEGRLVVRRTVASGTGWPVLASFRLAVDAGGARLEVENLWPAAATVGRERTTRALADRPRELASGYQAAAETIASAGDDLAGA